MEEYLTVESLIAKADEGEVIYQMALSMFYQKGTFVEQDFELSFAYMEMAAKQDEAEACFYVGEMYARGMGTEQDEEKANEWLKKSAELGFSEAYRSLAYDELARKDEGYADRFQELMQKSCDGNNCMAAYDLGVLLTMNEDEDKRDFVRAKQYFEMAARCGVAPAVCNLAVMYYNGDGVPQDMRKARQYFQKAAELGYPRGYTGLGILNLYGLGVPVNYKKALKCLKKAVSFNDPIACYEMGRLYAEGRIVEENRLLAERYFMLADQFGYKFVDEEEKENGDV